MNTEALIAAVRAGDIEAAQALLPVDPIVKRAREICARHMGTPSRWLDGSHDDGPQMSAVVEALQTTHSTVTDDQLFRMARAACYFSVSSDCHPKAWEEWRPEQFLEGAADTSAPMAGMLSAIEAALR